jgi:hypothetical protein
VALDPVAVDSAELSSGATGPRHSGAAHRRRAALGVREANVTFNVTFSWSAGSRSHTGTLAVKVDAPRRRHGR